VILLAIGVQALDLATFLIAAPMLVNYEVGGIGQIYIIGGPLLAIAWKAAVMSVVLYLAIRAGRYQKVVIAALLVAGAVGFAANTIALWQVGLI